MQHMRKSLHDEREPEGPLREAQSQVSAREDEPSPSPGTPGQDTLNASDGVALSIDANPTSTTSGSDVHISSTYVAVIHDVFNILQLHVWTTPRAPISPSSID